MASAEEKTCDEEVFELPWARASKRPDHPWHSMCSYLGAFPAAIPRTFIKSLTNPDDVVFDPFCGRGTTLLESRALDRRPIASDSNPIAYALTKAKNANVGLDEVLERIGELEASFDLTIYRPLAEVESGDIRLIYHPDTLAQLCYLRRRLLPLGAKDVDDFLVGAVLGIMHGKPRKDGSSAYLSISMPNTFSMSPDYVRRFVANNQLKRPPRNAFEILREKVKRLFERRGALGTSGKVIRADAKELTSKSQLHKFKGSVDLIMTSPPYLDVVNYAKQNWIRLWFLNEMVDDVHSDLDDDLTPSGSIEFMEIVLGELDEFLKQGGVMVLVIGDVARSKRSIISPARLLMRRLFSKRAYSYIGCLSDHLEVEGKTTRIWNDTKGEATAIDRVVIVSDRRPDFNSVEVTEKVGQLEMAPETFDFDAQRMEEYAKKFAGVE